jgi:hypothetical protein
VRQQWNFSPSNTIREVEAFQVVLSEVTVLELAKVPDISRVVWCLAQEPADVLTAAAKSFGFGFRFLLGGGTYRLHRNGVSIGCAINLGLFPS